MFDELAQTGDLLAFKILELNNRTPEIILKVKILFCVRFVYNFFLQEARVVSYDSSTDVLALKVEEAFLPPKPEKKENEEEMVEETEEPNDLIEVERFNLSDVRIVEKANSKTQKNNQKGLLPTPTFSQDSQEL